MIAKNRLPLLFVFLWSSAYIAFEFCSAYIEPATFVVVRTLATANVLFLMVLVLGSDWPRRFQDVVHSVVVGILIHAVYAGGLFLSIYNGIDVGLAALILSLQPLLTVLLSGIFLNEDLSARKIVGILVGLLGVSIVILGDGAVGSALISHRASSSGYGLASIAMCLIALFAISIATIVQKRYCTETKIMPGSCIQFIAAALFMLPFALVFEEMLINWSLEFVLSLSWLVAVVSIGAVSLLMLLIKHDDAGSVANLFYLVTPLVAIQAWLFFGENVTILAIFGMCLCISGVVIVNCAPVPKYSRRVDMGATQA